MKYWCKTKLETIKMVRILCWMIHILIRIIFLFWGFFNFYFCFYFWSPLAWPEPLLNLTVMGREGPAPVILITPLHVFCMHGLKEDHISWSSFNVTFLVVFIEKLLSSTLCAVDYSRCEHRDTVSTAMEGWSLFVVVVFKIHFPVSYCLRSTQT